MRRSSLTLPAPRTQPWLCQLSPRPQAAFGSPRATETGKGTWGAGPQAESSVVRAQVSQPLSGPILLQAV